MHVRLPLVGLLALALFTAGCLGNDPVGAASEGEGPLPPPPTHVLAGASEPEEHEAPTFHLLGEVARAGPVYGGGEPSIWAHLDGSVYLAFPGCDRGTYLVSTPGQERCEHGLVYRTADDGVSWTRLNRDGDGRLSEDGPRANGDADVAVDAAGVVYASNLGGGIQVARSLDEGATWEYVGNVVPEEHWADRQWMAAAAPGNLIMTWMGGETSNDRQVAVNATFDGGETWTGVEYLGKDIGWLGTVEFDATGERAFIPFTENRGGGRALFYGSATFSLLVARTLDAGATWDVVDTGIVVTTSETGGHWSGVLMAPAIAVTGDGHVVVAWSEEVNDPTGASSTGAAVKLVASGDWGGTWGAPVTVSTRAAGIMPWVVGGAGDRVAVTYFASDVPLDTDYAGAWDVEAAVVDGLGDGSPTIARSVVDRNVHQGGVCARGGVCLITGSDRALLDFFEADLLPDGRLVVTYPADPLTGGKYIEIRFAIQDGGTPLLVPAQGS